jgi:hypothetical protein
MAFIPILNTAQVSLQFAQSDGSFAENVFYVKRTSAWTSAELATMCAAFIAWFGTGDGSHSYKSLLANDTSLVEVSARDLTTAGSDVVNDSAGLPITGTSENATFLLGTTFAITHRTGLAGRSQRGRTFMVGLPIGDIDPESTNVILTAYATFAVDALTALIAAVTAADAACTWVVASRYSGVDSGGKPIPRAAGVVTNITSVGYHNLIVDFQRRRAPAHNRHH